MGHNRKKLRELKQSPVMPLSEQEAQEKFEEMSHLLKQAIELDNQRSEQPK
jgi:hypothetical protein